MKYELNKSISATKYESVGGESPYIRGWNDRFVENIEQKGGGKVDQERTTLKFMNGWLTRV
jgi:hypothetical protein